MPSTTFFDPAPRIAEELALPVSAVKAVVALLQQGATVPFIARYRKEATGALDEVQIRSVDERHAYITELQTRRESVLAEIESQGKLTGELRQRIAACASKAELEDLYLPFKPKRRTRGSMARERGLEPLAALMWAQGADDVHGSASRFVDPSKDVKDTAAALSGARDICAERLVENGAVRKLLRETLTRQGVLRVTKHKEFQGQATKFDMYASFEEPVAGVPSHRFLAIRRGEEEGVLKLGIELEPEPLLTTIRSEVGFRPTSPWAKEVAAAIEDAYKRLLLPSAQTDLRVELKMRADRAAVEVFAQNLQELLLAAPFGGGTVLGIDPGQRTGCKCAVVDATGKLLTHEVIYLVQGPDATARARATVGELCRTYGVKAVAVGNGTHGRETEQLVREVLGREGLEDVICVAVSEAGASVYSASEVARLEFPDLDLTVRGAVSIARRLQDPLAELVKVDPKSIGVGQYQHDIHQPLLAKKLDEVVESCVNLVGVELNTASAPLLARVAGIGASVANNIVERRNAKGPFRSRAALRDVSGVGPRTFEQAAGFLRIGNGEHPLDASGVHPERYPLVERMARDLGVELRSLVGHADLLKRVDKRRYFAEDVGDFTLDDILAELAKPGRDPRATFEPPSFRNDVRTLVDLQVGMELEGVITNVTAFGAFVDVGVHQDGLVHISKLSDKFVKDPSTIAKVGAKIRVRVLAVDLERKRISLSARRDDAVMARTPAAGAEELAPSRERARAVPTPAAGRAGHQRSGPQTPSKPDREAFVNHPFAKLLGK